MAGARTGKRTGQGAEPRSAEEVFAAAEAKAAARGEGVSSLDREGVAEHVADSARRRAAAGPQVYVVQVRGFTQDSVEPFKPHAEGDVWADVATVKVPPRSKRKTIIERALNASSVKLELPVTLRILDADAAREFPVGLRPRDPELVIG